MKQINLIKVVNKVYKNKELRKEFENWSNNKKTSRTTNLFYTETAPKYIEQAKGKIEYTYFDIKDINTDIDTCQKELVALYKIFSPEFLLKKSFANDSNKLDEDFYFELLHIIGLEQQEKGRKKIIARKKRKQHGSLIENTISTIETENRINYVENVEQYGKTRQEQIETITGEILKLKKENFDADISSLEKEINEIYELTKEEIKTVEKQK